MKVNNPQKKVRNDPIAWLLEPDNPSVRYLTLRHLLERSEDDPEAQAARAAIPHSRVVERIFARQTSDGSWGDPTTPYQPKYKASYWTLMLLGYLGLSREDERVQQAVEHIFCFQQPEGASPSAGRRLPGGNMPEKYSRPANVARNSPLSRPSSPTSSTKRLSPA
jgi:hypothetical protein